ncbi:hypothetical protein A1F94_001939 [Pyrenophora tritici-repentis]|uniref:Uncharacterized protein n=1 Tax=Pyrenophora tritici-repentis TaxID=45151 RepID=A0A2W1GVM1_9PLEO|nr:hypothetical protein PtrV1_02541 [Pyrenophora tritici-repentis]KAF7455298.1 hypothetical protein A1F99_025560 [Pyrenophora tritici-repentis]KAG9389046.1 hypothetical protein A1F94_001939 [Pyrenophora tritici-repentis]KAI0570731.1 hypothetical protein Alg130_11126 [Pyrenophora tritici-repentis]KAI0604659.1 hypothetical protein TUN205_11093 [Pyrenophora tritici-repentis]
MVYSDKRETRNSLLDNMNPNDYTSIPQQVKENSHETPPYVSFGDNGTTASLNAFGELIHISQAHESSRSGFFCVDLAKTPEPWFVQERTEALMNANKSFGEGMYTYTTSSANIPEESTATRLEFIHDRWPLLTTEYGHATLKVLHVAFKNTVFQQFQWSTEESSVEFPMDSTSKCHPELYEDQKSRDKYWHRTFEVPYALWQFRDSATSQSVTNKQSNQNRTDLHSHPNPQGLDLSSIHMEMKRWTPFNNFIVQLSIVELLDEWLYKFSSMFTDKSAPEDLEIIKDAISGPQVVVIDIPKVDGKITTEDPTSDIRLLEIGDMYKKPREKRTVQKSKKRLIWIVNPNLDTRKIYCTTSAKGETDYLDFFFQRHVDKCKYVSDEVTATANLWTTEFHLSSYRLSNRANDREETSVMFLGDNNLLMEREGAGFRFVGDFFDRYWTCHVLEISLQHHSNDSTRLYYSFKEHRNDTELEVEDACKSLKDILELKNLNLDFYQHKKPWRQRKVLELLLADQMLKKIEQRYRGIIQEMCHHLEQLNPRPNKKEKISEANMVSISIELFSKQMSNGTYSTFCKT